MIEIPITKDQKLAIESCIRHSFDSEAKIMIIKRAIRPTTYNRTYVEHRFVVAFMRSAHPFPDRPAATILVQLDSKGQTMAHSGHYDLSITDALADCQKRWEEQG